MTLYADETHTPAATRQSGLLYGLHIDAIGMDEAVDRCRAALKTRQTILVGVLNAAKIVSLRHDAELRNAILDCDMLLADGQSVVWASRMLHHPLPERVAGIDLFEELLELAQRQGRRIYLLGAKPDVLAALRTKIAERWPAIRIVGSQDGYFSDRDAALVADQIRDANADMLFLGMPSPKKEIFLRRFRHRIGVPILHGVGGSFDVMAGMTKRAPAIVQRLGMEWAFRLSQEPGRLWKRYLISNTAFIAMTLREMIHPSAELQRMPASDALPSRPLRT